MVQKTISLTPESYQRLKAKKKPNESFSELVDRLLDMKQNRNDKEDFKSFAGVLAEDEEWDNIEERMQEEGVIFQKRLTSPEALEAMTAFMERRKPDFSKFD